MDDNQRLLIRLLAEGDAVWLPQREWSGSRAANTYLARRDFPLIGTPYRSGESGGAERKAAQRLLESLTADGLAQVKRSRLGKTEGARLTAAGERKVRPMIGWDVATGRDVLAEVAKLTKRRGNPRVPTDAWITELKLAGLKNYSPWTVAVKDALVKVEFQALPALWAGWLLSNSTIHGQVYYTIMPPGWEVFDRGDPPPAKSEDGGLDDAGLFYAGVLRDALARLGVAASKDSREIGFIPLPVSME